MRKIFILLFFLISVPSFSNPGNDWKSWIQLGPDINGEVAGDLNGSVAMSSDGTIVAIGADRNDGNGTMSGNVRVYHLSLLNISEPTRR